MKLPPITIYAILCMFFCSHSWAQTDSLATKSYKDLEASYIEFVYTLPEKAKVYADAMYELSQKGTNQQQIAKSLYRKGYIYSKLGKHDEALNFVNESLVIAAQIHDTEILLQSFTRKGNIYLAKGAYTKAIEFYLKAKQIAAQTGDTNSLLVMAFNIAFVKKQIEDLQGAIKDFKHNLKEIKKLNSDSYERLEVANYLALADTYLREYKPDSALVYASKGLQKTSISTYPEMHSELYLVKVIVLFQKKQYEQSNELCSSLNKMLQTTQDKRNLLTPYLYYAKNHQALKAEDSAIFYFEKIKEVTKAENFSIPELEDVYYQLAKLYLTQKNIEKANDNFTLYEEFTKKNDSSNKTIHYTIKDHDITTLKNELNELQNKNEQQHGIMKYLYGITGILIILLLFFSILYTRNKKRTKKRFKELQIHIQKIESQKTTAIVNKQKSELAINDEGVLEILKKLEKFEQKQHFLHLDCTLSYTAKKLKTNTAYLSHVINTHKGKKFTAYLSELRINAALIGLKNNPKIRQYSMEAIANEFGFKRRETFSKAFKNTTGMDPSSYIKQLKKNDTIT